MGWQDDARRTVTGDKTELKSFPGYWVKAKKYSISAKDEINAVQRRLQKEINKKALASLFKKMKDKGKNIENPMDMLEEMTDEELASLLDTQGVEAKELTRVKIMHGVAEHNFCEEGVSKETEQFSSDITEYENIALEILAIVETFNAPLAKTTSRTSGMSQSGSTKEQSSSTETSSPTDESPQN